MIAENGEKEMNTRILDIDVLQLASAGREQNSSYRIIHGQIKARLRFAGSIGESAYRNLSPMRFDYDASLADI